MIKYNSTPQFHDVVKQIRSTAEYHSIPLPKIKFEGTVKMHGSNAAVVFDVQDLSKFHCQSRENIIDPYKDNFGFASFIHGDKLARDKLAHFASNVILDQCNSDPLFNEDYKLQIYGEWIGPGIQKSVGISQIKEKIFVVFKVRVGKDNEKTNFLDFKHLEFPDHPRIKSVYDFPTFEVEVDFELPTLTQNTLSELTLKVADDCPVARKLLPEFEGKLLGEGIVWSSLPVGIEEYDKNGQYLFKTKDPRHSVSKVKTIASVDPEKVKGIKEFIEYAVTDNRLNQGLDYLKESNLPIEMTSTGEFIKWVMKDILKEELETLNVSGIEPKDINGSVAQKAKLFFINKVKEL